MGESGLPSSATQIVATLPQLEPGTYRLRVTNGRGEPRTDDILIR